jgi:hypothetical protein
VCEQELDREVGLGGVLCGSARGKRFALRGHGERLDGKKHEEIRGLLYRHPGAFRECQAEGQRLAVAPRAPGAAPRVDHFRPVFETQQRPVRSTGGL